MRRPSPLDLASSPSSGDPHHPGRPQHAHSASPLAKQAPVGGGGGGHPHSHHNLPSSVAPPTTSSGSSYLSRNSSGGSSNNGTPTRQAPIVRSQPQLSKSTSAFSLPLRVLFEPAWGFTGQAGSLPRLLFSLSLFRHSAESSITQEERLATSLKR